MTKKSVDSMGRFFIQFQRFDREKRATLRNRRSSSENDDDDNNNNNDNNDDDVSSSSFASSFTSREACDEFISRQDATT
tara:strand:- start:86 stop:322 length:237 start_codon:yes stop_codon:yes gene_type:complete